MHNRIYVFNDISYFSVGIFIPRRNRLAEVEKHERLPAHPNCVHFIKAWEERGHLYIQTELCKMRCVLSNA